MQWLERVSPAPVSSFALAACVLGSVGCGLLDAPSEYQITVRAGDFDRGTLRVGLFAHRHALDHLESVDGRVEHGSVDLMIEPDLTPERGGISIAWASTHDDVYREWEPAEIGKVSIAPLVSRSVSKKKVRLAMPDEAPENSYMVVVWADANGDGLLDLGEDAEAEVAVLPHRMDHGAIHYLSNLWYDEDGNTGGSAHGFSGDGQPQALILIREQSTGWTADMSRR
jgi:hypothetical protein